ncbi:MAG TPA: permease-like cell division protein FtsX [Patescibacteria group bacterium]|nr:permease-like cell division protein FtsX [Patescibacteria group bacterium]
MIKTVKQHIFRSPYQSLAAILVVSFSLFLICLCFLLGAASQTILLHFEARPQVSAFLKDEVKPQEVELLTAKVQGTGKVKKVDYISKEEALTIYKEQNKDKPLLLEMVTAKILPASLEVSAYDLSSLKDVAEMLKKEPAVEDVIYQEDVVSTLANWMVTVRRGGSALAVFLLLVAVFSILVVLGMKISQRKEEIEILKLLGASAGYICLPFYLEGIIYGLLAAVVSWGLSYLIILYTTPFLIKFLAGIPLLPIPLFFMLAVLGGLLGLGVIIGFLGSFLAVSRFSRAVR